MKHIFLIGFMGCGKTTVSRALSKKTGIPELDLDKKITLEQQIPITEIFDRFGEEHFRNLETEAVKSLEILAPHIIACGGGTVLRQENVNRMKAMGTIVLLTASPKTILKRCEKSKDRPVLNGHMNVEFIESLMEKRAPDYHKAADLVVKTDDRSVEEIVGEIVERISRVL